MCAAAEGIYTASLPEMRCGCRLRVEELTGNPAQRSRLYALGILPGTELELHSVGCGCGNVVVRVRQASLVLDENTARCIFCRAESEHDIRSRRGGGCGCGCSGEVPSGDGVAVGGPCCRGLNPEEKTAG